MPANISITGRIKWSIQLGANWVRKMAANKHSGIEITNATTVTQSELRINGQKPNWLSLGLHSFEKIREPMACERQRSLDLMTSPNPIAKGSRRKTDRHNTIHREESLSINILLVMI
jgi:hypothetical protein